MKKLILTAALILMAGTAYASSAPSSPPDTPKIPVAQNFTVGNQANDEQAPVTLIITDANGVKHILPPGASAGYDIGPMPYTVDVQK